MMFVLVSVFAGAQVSAELNPRQLTQLMNNCVQCHADPVTGAPVLGDTEAWAEIMSRGEDSVLVNVVQGVRGMPPMGYCSSCSEGDFRQLIRFMAGIPEEAGDNGVQQ
jgi:cytochrome c5